jgi:outer membrane lipoprotein SlyB
MCNWGNYGFRWGPRGALIGWALGKFFSSIIGGGLGAWAVDVLSALAAGAILGIWKDRRPTVCAA